MEPQTASILAIVTYKIFCLAAGSFSIYLGYKLFEKGVFGHAGNMEGGNGNITFKITNAAPGTVFATVGLGVIIFTVQQGMSFTGSVKGQSVYDDSVGEPVVSSEISNPSKPFPQDVIRPGRAVVPVAPGTFTSAGEVAPPNFQNTPPTQPRFTPDRLNDAEIQKRLTESLPQAQVRQ